MAIGQKGAGEDAMEGQFSPMSAGTGIKVSGDSKKYL